MRWGRGCVWLGISGWRFSPCLSPEPSSASPLHLTLFPPLAGDSKKIKIQLKVTKTLDAVHSPGDSSCPPELRVSLQNGHQHTGTSLSETPEQVVLGPAHFAATAQFVLWSFLRRYSWDRFLSSSSTATCCLGIWELVTLSLCMVRWGILERPQGNLTSSAAEKRGWAARVTSAAPYSPGLPPGMSPYAFPFILHTCFWVPGDHFFGWEEESSSLCPLMMLSRWHCGEEAGLAADPLRAGDRQVLQRKVVQKSMVSALGLKLWHESLVQLRLLHFLHLW